MSIRVLPTERPDAWEVQGRGELQLAVLVETMRREGFELTVGKPQVVTREVDGKVHEPVERATIDVPEEFLGAVTQLLAIRKGRMEQMVNHGTGWVRLDYLVPARGLVGFRTEFMTETRGTGILHHVFDGYEPWFGELRSRPNGSMVADRRGDTTAYSLFNLQERGELLVGPGVEVYEGMIVGESSRAEEMDVNPTREKKLTNMRASGSDDTVRLSPPRPMSLEQALEFVADDECVEVTPHSVRLRKVDPRRLPARPAPQLQEAAARLTRGTPVSTQAAVKLHRRVVRLDDASWTVLSLRPGDPGGVRDEPLPTRRGTSSAARPRPSCSPGCSGRSRSSGTSGRWSWSTARSSFRTRSTPTVVADPAGELEPRHAATTRARRAARAAAADGPVARDREAADRRPRPCVGRCGGARRGPAEPHRARVARVDGSRARDRRLRRARRGPAPAGRDDRRAARVLPPARRPGAARQAREPIIERSLRIRELREQRFPGRSLVELSEDERRGALPSGAGSP